MVFRLSPQGLNVLTQKYNINKKIIVKIENILNDLEIIKTSEEYLKIIRNILIQIKLLYNEKNSFSNGIDVLSVEINMRDLIISELSKFYGKSTLKNQYLLDRIDDIPVHKKDQLKINQKLLYSKKNNV